MFAWVGSTLLVPVFEFESIRKKDMWLVSRDPFSEMVRTGTRCMPAILGGSLVLRQSHLTGNMSPVDCMCGLQLPPIPTFGG